MNGRTEIVMEHRFTGETESLSTKELLGRIAADGSALVKKEIELAKAELGADIQRELRMVKAFGVGALLALCAVNLFFVSVALALAQVMPAWGAALLVCGVLLLAAGGLALLGWRRRVRSPLERTRQNLKEDVKWLKHRFV